MNEQTVPHPREMEGRLRTVTVYAASSQALSIEYLAAARRLGEVLGEAGMEICFGGGGIGLMGAMADGALARGAKVHGVVPVFLKELEVSHRGLTSLTVVDDMRTRKHLMLENSDAVVALPGGCGTYEELFEALTLKRLGQWLGPIVLVNTRGFYNHLLAFLEHAVSERFMGSRHVAMWSVIDQPEQVLDAFRRATKWGEDALNFANVNG